VLYAAPNAPTLAGAAALLGVTGTLFSPAASALVIDSITADMRPKAFSLIHWAINIGTAIAAMSAGFLAVRGYGLLFLVGEGEDAHIVEPAGLHEPQELLEVGLGLAWEPDDEGGADGHAGHALADALDHAQEVPASGRPLHALEHALARVLRMSTCRTLSSEAMASRMVLSVAG
jgi:hypothetical protein